MPEANNITNSRMLQAFLAVQKSLPKLTKDGKNPHFGNTYVTLSELMDKVLPVLTKNGFMLTQAVGYTKESEPTLTTKLIHETGHELTGTMLLLAKSNDPQAQGSAITYARRYQVMSLLGLVGDEDDDGNRASEEPKTKKATVAQLQALRNMAVGFSQGKVKKDSADKAIMEMAEIKDINDLTFDTASALITDIKTNKNLPLDFDEAVTDNDEPEK